ncbi:MAG TPA: hypothetical protein VNY27_06495 [Solirubrobacteraceae bacterium]|jgi:hypothetical protein|nr:hypothetical protein [Solirubrobacteraceae bacterium]
MIMQSLTHPASARRRALVVALAVLVPLTFASSALAKAPTGPFAVFSDCPRFTSGVIFCIYSQTEGGEVKIGKSTVPINADKKHEIILQGGFSENETTGVESFVGAIDGNTLSKTPQNVPGGLAGLVNCPEISNFILRISCELVFENSLTGVTATTELAKPASEIGINTNNLINEEGVALSLPVKVKLDNPLLGSECYIGSSSSPVTLNLTTGTTNPPAPNKPIKGKLGKLEFLDEFTLIEITNSTLVDNAFSAPVATGCGGALSFILDPIIDAKLGLPSAAGKNTAIQNNRIREATAENVIKSEA